MDLLVNLLNPEIGPRLDRLVRLIASLEPHLASHRIVPRKLPSAQGQVLATMKRVLASHPEGLQTFEVRRFVEQDSGRKLPKSTVKDALASNPAFERIGHGRYRLR